jgi:Gram-negative porin
MRKLLMASAAILGASGSLAFAQAPLPVANPSQGQFAAPYGAGPAANNNNNNWGIANTPSGSAEAGPLSTLYPPNTIAVPAPGTVVIRLNGRVEVDMSAVSTTGNSGVNNTATGGSNGFKTNPVGIGSYMRLYPGFDGKAANGLRYGATIELRENFNSGVFTGSQTSTISTTATATSPSGNTSAQTVFVRRAFTYLASDQAGIVRFGQTDGVIGLFDPGIFTSQSWDAGIGNFNGGANQSFSVQGPVAVPFVWLAQAGADYANQKIVYLSPQFFGFDFGVQYAPSMGNAEQYAGVGVGCNQASASCIGLTSGNDATRWFNQVGLGLRYQQNFGPVDVKAYGFWETAGKENLTIGGYATTNQARLGTLVGGITSGAQNVHYDNLNFYKGGVAITALNTTFAADYIGGDVNGQLAMRPTGGAPTNAVVTGLTYANGPITLGAEIGIVDTQGDARLVGISQRHEYEIAFGGNYKLAPGVQLVGELMYTHRHQGGYDFMNAGLGAGGTATAAGVTRDAQSQSAVFSTVLTW